MNKVSGAVIVTVLTFVVGMGVVALWFYSGELGKVKIVSVSKHDALFVIEIDRVTNLGKFRALRKSGTKQGDIEVRVWRGFGLGSLEGVFLKRSEGLWSGLHVRANRYGEPQHVTVNQLQPPRSGWVDFWKAITAKGILSLPLSPENECDSAGNDGTSYVVEINQDSTYRNYFYHTDNHACRESKQMEEIGQIIGLEFDSGQEECKTTEWFACMTFLRSHEQTSKDGDLFTR